jgi:hypothetical protein
MKFLKQILRFLGINLHKYTNSEIKKIIEQTDVKIVNSKTIINNVLVDYRLLRH